MSGRVSKISSQRFGRVCGCVSLCNTLKFQPNFYYPVLQISISRVCNHTPRHLHDQEEEHQQNLEKQVVACLDDIHCCRSKGMDLEIIFDLEITDSWFLINKVCYSFGMAYQKGLNGPQVVWANRKYHGHRVLPNNIMETLEAVGKA